MQNRQGFFWLLPAHQKKKSLYFSSDADGFEILIFFFVLSKEIFLKLQKKNPHYKVMNNVVVTILSC